MAADVDVASTSASVSLPICRAAIRAHDGDGGSTTTAGEGDMRRILAGENLPASAPRGRSSCASVPASCMRQGPLIGARVGMRAWAVAAWFFAAPSDQAPHRTPVLSAVRRFEPNGSGGNTGRGQLWRLLSVARPLPLPLLFPRFLRVRRAVWPCCPLLHAEAAKRGIFLRDRPASRSQALADGTDGRRARRRAGGGAAPAPSETKGLVFAAGARGEISGVALVGRGGKPQTWTITLGEEEGRIRPGVGQLFARSRPPRVVSLMDRTESRASSAGKRGLVRVVVGSPSGRCRTCRRGRARETSRRGSSEHCAPATALLPGFPSSSPPPCLWVKRAIGLGRGGPFPLQARARGKAVLGFLPDAGPT